jgi:regulator of RNase E activity RraA
VNEHDAPSEIIARLKQLSCCDISDALDRLGIVGQCLGITPRSPSFKLAGRAVTLRYGLSAGTGGTVGDYVDDLGPDQVVAIDNAGRMDATVWGDILTSTAAMRGVAGTVIDGVCRDIDRSIELGYPIFSRGTYMRTGKDRVQLEEIGGSICIGGVCVRAGDWLRGDGDGAVSIPSGSIFPVLGAAEEIAATESQIRAAVEDGLPLSSARMKYGYHSLQSRQQTQ